MALNIETIPITIRTGTGAQTVSHILYPGVAAKAIVFTCSDGSGTTSNIHSRGISDGTNHIGMSLGLWEAFSVCLTARGYSSEYCILTTQAQVAFGGAQTRLRGRVTALSVGSFEITFDINNTPGAQWYATIIAGTDVSCKVGFYDSSAGAGSIDVDFQPAALITLGTVDNGAGVATTGEVAGASMNQGFATLCSSLGSEQVSWGVSAGAISSDADSYQLLGILDAKIDGGLGVLGDTYYLSSWLAEGWSLDGGFVGHWNLGYLAIGGDAVSANLVRFDQPAATGVQNTAIDALDPVAVFFGSTNKPTAGGINTDLNLTFGVYDGTSQLSHWMGLVDGSTAPYKRHARTSTTKSIVLATATGASASTVNAEASITLASENVAADWTTVDGTAREIWGLVLANNASVGEFNPCGVDLSETDVISCSIVIAAPLPIPTVGVQQWRLQRFDAKIREEQSA